MQLIYLFLFSCCLSLSAQPIPDLIAHYSFDNCDLVDETGIGGDGVMYGSPECVEGINGSALYFDGDDYVHFYGDVNGYFGTNDFTISFWIDIVSGARQNILGKRQTCNANQMLEFNYSGMYANMPVVENRIGVQLREYSLNGNVFVEEYDTLCWSMITFTRNGTKSSVYRNGILIEEQITSEIVNVADDSPLYISDSPCHTYSGDAIPRLQSTIDELSIYSRALSETEIQELFDLHKDNYAIACEEDEPPVNNGGILSGYPTIITIADIFEQQFIKEIKYIRPVRLSVYNENGRKVLFSNDASLLEF